jgi:hypothetical protein
MRLKFTLLRISAHIGPIPTIELRSEDGFGILLMLFDMRRNIFLHPGVRAYIMNPLANVPPVIRIKISMIQ